MRTIVLELRTAVRLLFFRASSEELRGLNWRHVALGLVMTWVVGMGRWWEDPRAGLMQHLGIGSVIYVFVLASFLWLLLWPLAREEWSFVRLLAFISLTSPPALLYAIPVRHGLELEQAQAVRLGLLAVVALWRVSLLAFYLYRAARFDGVQTFVATVFPLQCVMVALTLLNLEKVVFNIMGGIRPEDRSVNDSAYGVLFLISYVSILMSIPMALIYLLYVICGIWDRIQRRRASSTKQVESPTELP